MEQGRDTRGKVLAVSSLLAGLPLLVSAWHPLRPLNAVNVRMFGADLLTVHVRLNTARAGELRAARPAHDIRPGVPSEVAA